MPRVLALLASLTLLFASSQFGAFRSTATQAQTVQDPALAIKAAARQWIASVAPAVTVVEVKIVAAVRNYVSVRVYPTPGSTDPALVVLRYNAGTWTAVAGPGTAFPPGDSRGGAPDDLFDDQIPYTGASAKQALTQLGGAPTGYAGAGLVFQYPADAMVTEQAGTDGSTAQVTGPTVEASTFPNPAYTITVTRLYPTSTAPLDEWGYDRMLAEIGRRLALGGPEAGYIPLRARSYQTGRNNIFQIDWFGGDSTLRDFFVAPVDGGPVTQVNTRVYPVQNNPAAPQAEAALTLLLQLLQPGG